MKIYATLLIIFIANFAFGQQKLTDYKSNVYSQFGEDGIIKKIFETIGTTSKIAIEFGATDGFWCSNTANLWTKDDWFGILIESSGSNYTSLVANVAKYPCLPILKTVGITAEDSLESILETTKFSDDPIDLLSIDIDGNDYYIFDSLTYLRPRVIICEYNVSIPAQLDVYGQLGNYMGCSVAALERIAAKKGYKLIAITDRNCFFVVNEEFDKFSAYDTDREHLRIDRYISYIISGFSGQYQVIGSSDRVDPWGWANQKMSDSCQGNIQVLPTTVSR